MKNHYALLISVLLFLSVGIAWAQDENPAEEFLQWLPDIPYMVVLFDNDETLQSTDSYEVFRSKVARRISGADKAYLPAAIAKNVRWYGYANSIKVRLSPRKEDSKDTPKGIVQNIDVSNRGERLFVARCDLLAESVKAALANGEMTQTDERVGNSQVYSYQSKSKNSGHEGRYGIVDAGEYFISSDSVPMLRKMVAAQRGEAATLLESPDYGELQDLLEVELAKSHIWLASMMKMTQRVNEEFYRRNVDATDQQLENFRERQQQKATAIVISFHVSDEAIEEWTIYGFVDEETAEEMAPMFSKTPMTVPEYDEYRRLKDQVMRTTVRDRFVISHAVYSENIIAAFSKALETLESESPSPESKK